MWPIATDGPIQRGSGGEAGAGRQCIDDEVRQPSMPAGRPELQNFNRARHRNRNESGLQPVARICKTEGEPDDHKGKGVFTALAEVGMRSILGRP